MSDLSTPFVPGDPPGTEAPSLDQAVLDLYETRSTPDSETPDTSSETPPVEETPPESTETPAPDTTTSETETAPETETSETETLPPSSETPPEIYRVGDREIPADEMQRAVQVFDWARSLTPAQSDAIDALFSGQYQLVPVGGDVSSPAGAPSGGDPNSAGSPPSPSQSPSSTTDEEWDDLPESFRTRFQEMQQRVDALSQGDMQARQAQVVDQLSAGSNTFRDRHGISEEQVGEIQSQLARLGTMPGFVQAAGGDYSRAMEMALESVYWTDDRYRSAEIERRAAEQVEAERVRARGDADRKRKAGSLSGSSGSVSRDAKPPQTPADRRAAMTREVAEVMNRGVPS